MAQKTPDQFSKERISYALRNGLGMGLLIFVVLGLTKLGKADFTTVFFSTAALRQLLYVLLGACLGFYFFGNPEQPGGILVSALFWGFISIIGLLVPNKDDIVIVNGNKEIRLFRTKPSEVKVLEFANHLINIANNIRKVILIDFDLSEEHFLDNIQYLFAINLINRKELEELKSEYKLKQLL